ncbi:MAG: glycosyltransferase family 39 protein [Desulfobacterales bacterium]|nr:glycosyltransferase family 39 protein [Desulfobacterales bacterium]
MLLAGFLGAVFLARFSCYEQKPIFLFIAAWVSGALFWGVPEVIVDTSRYFTQAKGLELFGPGYFLGHWGNGIFAWTDLPLMPFIYGLVFKYLGEARIYIQLLNTTFFGLTALLTYLIGKTFWGREVGFRAGLLLLGMPYIFSQVPLMLVDVPSMFFLTLSVYTLATALDRGGVFYVSLAAGSLFLAFFVKYSLWLFLSVNVFVFLVYLKKNPGPAIRRCAAVLFLFVLFAGTVVLARYDFFVEQITFIKEYQKPGLGRWSESFVSTFLFQVHPFITMAALFSGYRAVRKRDFRYLVISYLVLLLVFLQIKRIRYILPILPMLALLASYGLCMVKDRVVRKFIICCAVGCSLAVALAAYQPFLRNMGAANLKDAGFFLDKQETIKTALVVISRQGKQILNQAVSVPLLDLYTNKKIIYNQIDPAKKPADFLTSSLRFTWEYQVPGFYLETAGKERPADAVVVVATRQDMDWSPSIRESIKGFDRVKMFGRTTGVFKHQTFVTIYYH